MVGFLSNPHDLGVTMVLIALIGALVCLLILFSCLIYIQIENLRLQRKLLLGTTNSINNCGELDLVLPNIHCKNSGQIKLNFGKQVISVVELNGNHYIRVNGAISEKERQIVLRYLKSEGFVV